MWGKRFLGQNSFRKRDQYLPQMTCIPFPTDDFYGANAIGAVCPNYHTSNCFAQSRIALPRHSEHVFGLSWFLFVLTFRRRLKRLTWQKGEFSCFPFCFLLCKIVLLWQKHDPCHLVTCIRKRAAQDESDNSASAGKLPRFDSSVSVVYYFLVEIWKQCSTSGQFTVFYTWRTIRSDKRSQDHNSCVGVITPL